jgi:ribosomal-protein-alanine N-acetyltransferase
MILQAERLVLREISWDDLENIHKLHSIPEVDEFNTLGIPENLDVTRTIVQDMLDAQKASPQKIYTWNIILQKTNEFIGLAGMNLSHDKYRMGEIYYKLIPIHWRKGYATEVSKRLILCGFENFNLHRIEAGVATENKNSIKVLKKSGMTYEGLRREILPIRGKWVDNYEYAILENDPRDY